MRYTLILALLFPQVTFACDLIDMIQIVRPKAVWNLSGTTLSGLQWLDKTQTPPTQDEIDKACAAVVPIPSLEDRVTALEAAVKVLQTSK